MAVNVDLVTIQTHRHTDNFYRIWSCNTHALPPLCYPSVAWA